LNKCCEYAFPTLGAVVGTGVSSKRAAADWHHGWGGGSCFARGTAILTRDGYRAIESLAAGTEVAVRFAGFAPIKAIDSFTLDRAGGTTYSTPPERRANRYACRRPSRVRRSRVSTAAATNSARARAAQRR
jgi:hypothetical protein